MLSLLCSSTARPSTRHMFSKPRAVVQWSCIFLKDQGSIQFESRRQLRIKAGSSIPYWRDFTRHDAVHSWDRRNGKWILSRPVYWLIGFYLSAMIVLVVYMYRPYIRDPTIIESPNEEQVAITEQPARKESWTGRLSRRLLGFTNASEKTDKPVSITQRFEVKLPHIWRDPEVLEEVCKDLINEGIAVQRASLFNWGLIYFSYTVERPTIEEVLGADKELGRKVVRKMWELKMIEMVADILKYGETFYKRYVE